MIQFKRYVIQTLRAFIAQCQASLAKCDTRLAKCVIPALGFWHRGNFLVNGVDYHGDYDRQLIQKYGILCLNFCPSTPPRFR